VSTRITPENLLVRSGLQLKSQDPYVVERMQSRYSSKVLLALQTENPTLIREAYDWTQSLPKTNTCRELLGRDIVIDGCLIGNNEYIEICFVKGVPSVLKTITKHEYNRITALLNIGVSHPNLVSCKLETVYEKYFAITPLFPVTIEHLCGIPVSTAFKLVDQVGNALRFLHTHEFAHKDIKSANICVNSNGDFVVIDFGSTEKFGYDSPSTMEYIPTDVEANPSRPEIDWWMLAMTVYDRLQPAGAGVRTGNGFTRSQLVAWFASKGSEYQRLIDEILSNIT